DLDYLGRFCELKRAVTSVTEITETEVLAFVRQPQPPPQPVLLACQLRQVARIRYQIAPTTTRPTGINCHSIRRSSVAHGALDQVPHLVHGECCGVGQQSHVDKGEQGPPPGVGLAPDYRQRRHTLTTQREEHHQR